jgi:hypothetical protein
MACQDQSAYGAAIGAMAGNQHIRARALSLGAQLSRYAPVDLRAFMQAELDRSLS